MLSPRVGTFMSFIANPSSCHDCIVDYIGHCEDTGKEASCPACNKGPVKVSDLRSVQRRRRRNLLDKGDETSITLGKVDIVSSTKLRALARKLEQMRQDEPQFKALVFSQFTSFLGALRRRMRLLTLRPD